MSVFQVFYDAQCPICIREMALVREQNVSGSLNTVPIQGNEALLAQYGVEAAAAMALLHVVADNGAIIRGMPALRIVYRECGGRPLAQIWNWPLLDKLADWGYPWFARHRYRFPRWLLPCPQCESGVCRKPPGKRQQ